MDELTSACQKFISGAFSIEDLYRLLSWIAVPTDLIESVSNLAIDLERIRFSELEENWHKEGTKLVIKFLENVERE